MVKGKYNSMNPVLELINKDYISLPEDETKRNNAILQEFLHTILYRMTLKDSLFKKLFNRVFYGGSYFDGLKVGHPNEYDLDLLLNLNEICETKIISSETSGYVHVELKRKICAMKPDFFTDDLLDNAKVRSWMESVVTKTLNDSNKFIILSEEFTVLVKKSGPAFTVKLRSELSEIDFDIDLVPCFEFQWSDCPNPYRSNNTSRRNIFIVPKPFKSDTDIYHYHFWRLSFQEQERDLLSGKQFLKPAIKLVKKMRDVLQHKGIASYFIKTVALWENDNYDLNYWNISLSEVFMNFLKLYYNYLVNHYIPFYWFPQNNLLSNLNYSTIENFKNRIERVIEDIDNHLEDPYRVIIYLLSKEELKCFKRDHKYIKSIQDLHSEEYIYESDNDSERSKCIIL